MKSGKAVMPPPNAAAIWRKAVQCVALEIAAAPFAASLDPASG
jgi:hypothetical protein